MGLSVFEGVYDNVQEGTSPLRIATDALLDTGLEMFSTFLSTAASAKASAWFGAKIGAAAGSAAPIGGNVAGAIAGAVVGVSVYVVTDVIQVNGKSLGDTVKDFIGEKVEAVGDYIGSFFD